ncbi:pentapeptide repeat-containing protein [Fulvivirgaceae bacterium BMA12]|uniref:Pentapeptide repeat-containing protein n=1 Tax=Agaribacillus aureus TaxID=3051825 RepID=A0ABT8LF52_9BACT|nr:pentapeptide repeat-containing protein [Fulvivirgaceae bacterium BMA12]
MIKRELIDRWKTVEGQQLLAKIIVVIIHNRSLEEVQGLEKYADRWDLRGATLSIQKTERKIEGAGTSFTERYGTLKLKNLVVESIDFSHADISYSWWERCCVSNCLFEETKARELRVYASHFLNCNFQKTNFTYSYLNQNIGKSSGSFKSVNFIECNLKECIFSFPKIESCTFDTCNLVATNFDGSRFRNCKFKGSVDSPWFSGSSKTAQRSLFGFFNRVNPRNYPNPMENVDFSEAELTGVSFINGIDLSNCIFPDDTDRYILVKNLKKVYYRAREIINKEWHGEEKRKGLGFIDVILYKPDRQNQEMDLIDKAFLTDDDRDSEFGDKFFTLIKQLNTPLSLE